MNFFIFKMKKFILTSARAITTFPLVKGQQALNKSYRALMSESQRIVDPLTSAHCYQSYCATQVHGVLRSPLAVSGNFTRFSNLAQYTKLQTQSTRSRNIFLSGTTWKSTR